MKKKLKILKFNVGDYFNKKTKNYCCLGAISKALGADVRADPFKFSNFVRKCGKRYYPSFCSEVVFLNDHKKWKDLTDLLIMFKLYNKVKRYSIK